jgi:hypothetical protein
MMTRRLVRFDLEAAFFAAAVVKETLPARHQRLARRAPYNGVKSR